MEISAAVVTSDGKTLRAVTGSSVAEVLEKANVEPNPNTWVWLNFVNATPEPDALEELLGVAELSPTVGVVGPKQVSPANPRVITQLGMTLTPLGNAFSPVSGQLDQSQHDSLRDVLAVGIEGMLIRGDVLSAAGGWSEDAPEFAADIDFCIRVRMAGFKVAVAPEARVTYAGRAAELGSKTKVELRKAAVHLRLRFSPIPLALGYWLLLLPISIVRVFYRLAQKRPDRIWSELRGAFWGFFTIIARLRSRSVAPVSAAVPLKAMKSLRASWEQVRTDSRSRTDADEERHNLAAFERGDFEQVVVQKSFSEASGWLFMFLLLAASWASFPAGLAPSGGAVIPLSERWSDLFAHTGASWQTIGLGFAAPSDPFNWVLLLLGSATFWAPTISIAILFFAAKALAFAGAWRAIGLVTSKVWVKTTLGIGYALTPGLTLAVSEGRVASVVAAITLPWLVLSIARAAGFGRRGSARSDRQTWSWVAASGLSFAVFGVSAPSMIPLVLFVLAIAAFTKIRRFGYLFWIPLPLAALFAPYAYYQATHASTILGALADPGVPHADSKTPLIFAAGLAAIALTATLAKRWLLALVLALTSAVLIVSAWFVTQVSFGEVAGSPLAIYSAAGLALSVLAALTLDGIEKKLLVRLSAAGVLLAVVAPLGYQSVTTSNAWTSAEARVVPWLLETQAKTTARMVEITPTANGYDMEWLPVRGAHLDDQNSAYRLNIASHVAARTEYQSVAQVIANLASSNGVDDSAVLANLSIGYVLVPANDSARVAELATALDSSSMLESAGVTEFGRLWRVVGAETAPLTDKNAYWSITKTVQLVVLAGFLALAIPTRRAGKRQDSEIFLEETEDAS